MGVVMSQMARRVVVAVAVLCGLLAVGLVVVALVVDLDTADRSASVAGSVLSAVGLAISVYALNRNSTPPVSGARSVVAGGSIGRAVTGDGNHLSTPALALPAPGTPPQSGTTTVPAAGERGVSAGGTIHDAVTGDNNQG